MAEEKWLVGMGRKELVGPISVWLVLWLMISLWMAVVSPLRSLTAEEQAIPLWPPSGTPADWLGRVLLSPRERWDVDYYVPIAAQGYRTDDGTAPFHPLYPMLARPLMWLGAGPLAALTLVSALASCGVALLAYCWMRLEAPRRAALTAVLFLLVSPFAFAFYIPYSEALFVCLAILCFLWLRQGRWALAGFAAGAATLTRQQGLFLALPVAWVLWQRARTSPKPGRWRLWLALLPIPLAYGGWILYRGLALGDVRADFSSVHNLIYSLLISPSAGQVVAAQTFMWPWRALWLALEQVFSRPDLDLIVNLVGGAWFVLLMLLAWRRMRVEERIYSAAIALVSFSYHTGPVHPYMGLLRHLLLAFPVFLRFGEGVTTGRGRLYGLALHGLGLMFLLFAYVMHAWVP